MDGLKRVWNKQMSRMRLGGIESTKDEFEKIDDEEKQPFEKMTPLMLKIILMIVHVKYIQKPVNMKTLTFLSIASSFPIKHIVRNWDIIKGRPQNNLIKSANVHPSKVPALHPK